MIFEDSAGWDPIAINGGGVAAERVASGAVRPASPRPANVQMLTTQALAGHESIVLTPGPDGYTAKPTVRNGTGRSPEGGGLFVVIACALLHTRSGLQRPPRPVQWGRRRLTCPPKTGRIEA